MASLENFYSLNKAAEFLHITQEELKQLTEQGDIMIRLFRGKQFYLGGELDCIRYSVRQKLRGIPA